MVTRAFIQEDGNGRMTVESRDLLAALPARGIEVGTFTAKRLERGRLPLTRETLVAGYVSSVLSALRQLGVDPPPTNDYPPPLTPYLRRRVWQSTVGAVREVMYDGALAPCFVKPLDRKKRFTGRVISGPADLSYLAATSGATAVWCSEVVGWLTEYRVYVVRGDVVGVCHYEGDSERRVDIGVVEEAVARLEASGEATAGYSLDFGLLEDGTTALVEWNDGYSLGSYGLDKDRYADLILARWMELGSAP